MPGHRRGAAARLGRCARPTRAPLRLAWVSGLLRSDNGSEFTAKVVREWLARLGVETLYIEPGSPLENGYVESFNGKLRDGLLDREIFYTLQEAQVLIERWRQHYNRFRPHSALGYQPPAPEAIELGPPGMLSLPLAVAQGLT